MMPLAALAILLLLTAQSCGEDLKADGPHLEVSSTSGRLVLDRPSVLSVELRNIHRPSEQELECKRPTLRIVACFYAPTRGSGLSGPQLVGDLAPGMSISVRFTLREGTQKGFIH
jgi:hypothetical protein